MVGYSADDYLRFSADKETIYYSEPVYACEDAYVLPTNDNSEQWGVRSDGHWICQLSDVLFSSSRLENSYHFYNL